MRYYARMARRLQIGLIVLVALLGLQLLGQYLQQHWPADDVTLAGQRD